MSLSAVGCTGTYLRVYAQSNTMRHVDVIVDRHVVVRASYWRYVSDVYIDPQFAGRACGLFMFFFIFFFCFVVLCAILFAFKQR